MFLVLIICTLPVLLKSHQTSSTDGPMESKMAVTLEHGSSAIDNNNKTMNQ